MTNINEVCKVSGKLKDLKRRGWILREVEGQESVAEHSFAVALLVLLYAPKELDKLRCFELAIAHDLQEVYAGDWTVVDKITLAEKHKIEEEGIKKIAADLSSAYLVELFNEFEEQKTDEAIFVKSLDKLEAIMQSKYFEENGSVPHPGLYAEFFNNGKHFMKDENVKFLLEMLEKL